MIVAHFVVNLALFLIPAALLSLGCSALSRASRDEWRLLAWVPVLPLALWALYIAVAATRDPTSHNMWPFELIAWAALSAMLLGGFLIARRIFGGPRTDWVARRDRRR